jgi:hypothetical protein
VGLRDLLRLLLLLPLGLCHHLRGASDGCAGWYLHWHIRPRSADGGHRHLALGHIWLLHLYTIVLCSIHITLLWYLT